MNGFSAIYKKEMRSYFFSPLAYVLIGVFLWIMGVIFSAFTSIYQEYMAMSRYGQSAGITVDRLVSQLFQNMAFILCFISPMLTMKLFAEEKRQSTFELLFTAPISGLQLVIGKFASALTLMCVMLSFSFCYIAFLMAWGNPEMTVIFTTYLGLVLALCCYLSLGGLISALSNSQAIAAVWTFIALLLLWLLQTLGQRISTHWGPIAWGPTLTYMSPLGHFNPFVEGIIHAKDVVYFITFTGLMLFLTHRAVESNRWR